MMQNVLASPLPVNQRSEAFTEDLSPASYTPAPPAIAGAWPLAVVTVLTATSLLSALGLTFAGVWSWV